MKFPCALLCVAGRLFIARNSSTLVRSLARYPRNNFDLAWRNCGTQLVCILIASIVSSSQQAAWL